MISDFDSALSQINDIANDKARPHAVEVDAQSRFPVETINELKRSGLLAIPVDKTLGGMGFDLAEQGMLCRVLANACASSAMIYGMHLIKLNSLSEWGAGIDFFCDYQKSLLSSPRLIASMTSEEGVGGNLRHSEAALVINQDKFSVAKASPCLSYVSEADDIMVTCRASEQSTSADQRLVLLSKEQLSLNITAQWQAMGMRGTCSHACEISGEASVNQIFETPFAEIAALSMVPDAHIIWANIWLGIAQDAYGKARKVSKKHLLKNDSQTPQSAIALVDIQNKLVLLEDTISHTAKTYVEAKQANNQKLLKSLAFANRINSLKLNASKLARDICVDCLNIAGFTSYANTQEGSLEKNIRDVLSAGVMVSNERLVEVNAARLLVSE